MVPVGDRGTVAVEGAVAVPGLGALGEEGGQRLGGGGQSRQAAGAAPQLRQEEA